MKINSLKKRVLLLFSTILLLGSVNIQAQNLDSLEQVLKKPDLTIEEKRTLYDDLSWYYHMYDLNKAIKYALEGIEFAKKHNDAQLEASIYRNLAYGYIDACLYDSAKIVIEKGIKVTQKHQLSDLEASLYHVMGNVYVRLSDYETALDYYIKSLKINEEKGNTQSAVNAKTNIGVLYANMRNYQKAELYLLEAKTISEENEYLNSLSTILSTLSNIYCAQNRYEEGLDYAKRALEIDQKTGNINNEIVSLLNISSYYRSYYKDYEKALECGKTALELAEKADFPLYISGAHNGLCMIYYDMGNDVESVKHAQKALNGVDSTDYDTRITANEYLAYAYINLGKKQEAKACMEQVLDLMLKNTDKEQNQTLTEMEIKYETEKKELKINALEKEKQLYVWLGVAGGIILLLLLVSFIIRQRLAVNKRKLVEQQLKQVEQEKQLIATQAALDGENAERSRLARDLHDGLGSMLSLVKITLPEMKNGGVLEADDINRFQKAINMLDESINELRRVAHHIMPESLTRYGLKASLTDFCHSTPSVEFHHFGNDQRLDSKLEILIYRATYELINNALKHAKATQINVQLVQEDDRISLTVLDNGKGFDTEADTKGMGFENIRNRMKPYNGKMTLYSLPEKGTEVNVEISITN